MIDWSDSWLKTAGCADILLEFTSTDGKIQSIKVRQTPFNPKVEDNRLRVQKFQIAALNESMEVVKVVTHMTSDSAAVTEVPEFLNDETPHCFLINYQAQGYAKFIIDNHSLKALENGLHKIKCSMTRKQLYKMLHHMIKFGNIEGARALSIFKNNLQYETAEEILQLMFTLVVPLTIQKYMPVETTDSANEEIYKICLSIIESGRFKEIEATQQMLLTALIGFAKSEASTKTLLAWFNAGSLLNQAGAPLLELTLKQRHQIVKKVFASLEIAQGEKDAAMAKLAETKSDLLQLTQCFC